MLSTQDEEILSLVENYRIHLIEPASLSNKELDKFHTSLKEVLSFIKYSTNKRELEKLVENNEKFAVLDKKAAMVINVCTNSKLKIDTNQEVIDMCKAIADMRFEERTEGIQEGALAKAKETAFNLYKMGMEPELIAKAVNVSVELVKEWLREVL